MGAHVRVETNGDGLPVVTKSCGKYTYSITSSDLKMEQEAFEAGVKRLYMYICIIQFLPVQR